VSEKTLREALKEATIRIWNHAWHMGIVCRRRRDINNIEALKRFLDDDFDNVFRVVLAAPADAPPEHRCGVQGFDGMEGDVCPKSVIDPFLKFAIGTFSFAIFKA